MSEKEKKGIPVAVKVILWVLAVLLLVVFLYVAYVFVDYGRLEDNLELEVEGPANGMASAGTEYTILTWNIGFGAYTADYSFFMDGGKESWARSKDDLDENLRNISSFIAGQDASFYMIQEVDTDSTRTYHVNELDYILEVLGQCSRTFAQNWDSPFLFYPLSQPHGKSRCGIVTFSSFGIESAVRKSLPIEDGAMKLVDLDRCYSISYVPVSDGRYLVLFNVHLSAYTSDGTIAVRQLELLLSDMQKEYEKGNWCIAGGDFNKDLIGGGSELYGVSGSAYNWAQPIPDYVFEGTNVVKVGAYDPADPVASCRNPDTAYWPGQYQITPDGFMVTDNVSVVETHVVDTGFAYSDHNPVSMTFVLN